jgi:hypothetical protein
MHMKTFAYVIFAWEYNSMVDIVVAGQSQKVIYLQNVNTFMFYELVCHTLKISITSKG